MTGPEPNDPARTPLLEACGAQVRLLWRSRRPLLLLCIVGVVLAVTLLYHTGTGEAWSLGGFLTPGWYTLLFVLGGAWGILVWHEEGPTDRWYHWSFPLDTTAHDAARVLAGAVWLGVAVLSFLAAIWAVIAVTGAVASMGRVPVAAWLNFATNALLGYVLLAALSTTTRRALEWALFLSVSTWIMVFELVLERTALPGAGALRAVLEAVFLGDLGLRQVLQGMGGRARIMLGDASAPVRVFGDPGPWLGATLLWIGAGTGLFLAASLWHRRTP